MDSTMSAQNRKRNPFLPAWSILGMLFCLEALILWDAAFATMGLTLLFRAFEFFFGLILLLVVLSFGKMRKWTSRTYASAGWACLLWIGWGFVGIQYYWPVRYWGLERASHRADPLISALERFTKEQGRPPAKLSELLPRYIREIPTTGLPAYPTFKYERLPGRQSLAFWDLGSRNGLPMRGLWVYPDGKPEHAIMALTLSERGEVLDARMDRMPEQVLDVAFDQAKWKSGVERMRMVRLFAKTHSLKGRTLGELKKILGEPAGTRCLVDASWEIRIDCPMGILNWDTFYYWPTQRYPKQSHGGGVVRVGKWAYVHE